jgi:hypothetical protein
MDREPPFVSTITLTACAIQTYSVEAYLLTPVYPLFNGGAVVAVWDWIIMTLIPWRNRLAVPSVWRIILLVVSSLPSEMGPVAVVHCRMGLGRGEHHCDPVGELCVSSVLCETHTPNSGMTLTSSTTQLILSSVTCRSIRHCLR